MKYCNIIVPLSTAELKTDEDVFTMLKAVIGKDCEPAGEQEEGSVGYDAHVGSSGCGPFSEGDISFYDKGGRRSLAYDFMDVGNGVARVFRYEIYG